VKSNPAALTHAASVSNTVYNEDGTEGYYWEKYYKGVTEKDKQGLDVELGGSKVNNLVDNMLLFGLVPGSANLFAATYTVFGDIVVDQYPELVPNYPKVDQILDTSYVKAIAQRSSPQQVAQAVKEQKPAFTSKPAAKKTVVSRKAWRINFASGKAQFTPSAQSQLNRLLKDLLVAGGTTVAIHGHTDSQGNPEANMSLSEQRAFAVKQWLEKKSPVNFPSGRVQVHAHGSMNPVAPNSSDQGRALNRRVEVVLSAE
jgi:OmpA-OmpF porin, OOP family